MTRLPRLLTAAALLALAAVYLYNEIEVKEAVTLPLKLGSDDGPAVFLNGKRILADTAVRGVAPDQAEVELALVPGKNRLLLKVTNVAGEFAVYAAPELPAKLPAALHKQLARDFEATAAPKPGPAVSAEGKYYRIVTPPVPKDCVLEVGGLAMRPDGSLLVCTRRGEVWLVKKPNADDPPDTRLTLFATGMHEALGIRVDPDGVFVVQRPEVTRLVSNDGETAEDYVTVCDKWGVSGDYHEFAFSPAPGKQGHFLVTTTV